MTSNDSERSGRFKRRTYLAGLGTGVAAGLAGCGGGGTGQETTTEATTTEATTTAEETTAEETTAEETTTEESAATGGTPVVGQGTSPDTLNILTSRSNYAFTIIDRLYTLGTRTNPQTGGVVPWGFEDWTLNVDNIGGSSPTIVAEMRDDLTFTDGNKVTASDAKFVIEYLQEQNTGGSFAPSNYAAVESVEVDSPDGTTVNFFLSEKDNAWATAILGIPFLPESVWKDVSDATKFTPRNEENGLVGSGPMALSDYNWENWYEMEMRDKEHIPFNGLDYTEWLDAEGPFIDGLRVEDFGSQTALEQALLDGDIDHPRDSVVVDQAAKAASRDDFTVAQSDSDGWNHFTWNTRRVPFDDPAFGRFLVMMFDSTFNVEELYQGLGAKEGSYASPVKFQDWRPPEPTEIDEYEGIPVPDLAFPGEAGTFQVGSDAVQAARDFLVNNDDAKHDYSFGEAQTGNISSPDNQELYVNGKPFGQAHTDNDGNEGQGPLEHSFNPPQSDVNEARASQRWVGALQKVGVPAETMVQSFNSQIPKVFVNENFDSYAIGWVGQNVVHSYFSTFFGPDGIDEDGSADQTMFNAGAYTGSNDLIEEQATLMSLEERKPIVRKILAQMWYDAPTLVTEYPILLQPTTDKFTGYVTKIGGIANNQTYLNLRLSE